VSLMLVGGINLSWEYLITGEALKQLAPLLAASAHGEVVVSPKCWAMVQDACEGAAIGSEMQVIAIRPKFLQPMPKIQPTNLPLVAEAAIRYECHCGSGSSSMINTLMNVGGDCVIDHVVQSCAQQCRFEWMPTNQRGSMSFVSPRRCSSRLRRL